MPISRYPDRTRILPLAGLVAVLLLLAVPGLVVAKWTVEVDFETTLAVAGEPATLAAIIEIEGHDGAGESMPTLADVEAVQFELRPVGGGEALVVPAAADPELDGRYRAEVTMPDPGEWRVELVFVVDGHRMPHHDFPDQQPYLLTVEPSPPATASAAPMPGTLLAAGAAIGGLVIAYRQVRRRARSVPAA
jgi:hypothetical protein